MYIHIDYGHLLILAEKMAEHIGLAEATISTKIVGHARLFSRLRGGRGCNAHTFREAMIWFQDNWPLDLSWPDDVPEHQPFEPAGPCRDSEDSTA